MPGPTPPRRPWQNAGHASSCDGVRQLRGHPQKTILGAHGGRRVAAIADFARKFGLILKACNLSRGALAQGVSIDKSVASRWASGVQTPTDHNLGRLTDLVGQHVSGFVRSDWERDRPDFAERLGLDDDLAATGTPLTLPDRPSIAVLPFLNIGVAPDEDYIADGIAEDVINALTRFRSLFIIARNSSFTYKGSAVDVRRVARQLGVRYVVEGSVRKAGRRIRVTAQLVDATSGRHIWFERYDRQIEDVLQFQDEISGQIVSAINVELIDIEARRAGRKAPGSLDAWEFYHRGMRQYDRSTRESNDDARRLFEAAVAADPEHALAHAGLACTFISEIGVGLTYDAAPTVAQGLCHARRAVELDGNDALAHAVLGRLQVWAGETQIGLAALEKAIALNPNLAYGFRLLGEVYAQMGRAADAVRTLDAGIRLSPRDPGLWVLLMDKSGPHARLGDHASAIACAQRAIEERPDQFWPYLVSATVLAIAGRLDDARVHTDAARGLRKDLSMSTVEKMLSNMKVVDTPAIMQFLRAAGLPD